MLAQEVFHCLPDELLQRASSRQIEECLAYHRVKARHREQAAKDDAAMRRRYESGGAAKAAKGKQHKKGKP